MNDSLPIDLVGFGAAGPFGIFPRVIKRLSCPEGQLAECTWRLEVVWEGGAAWTIQGAPTVTGSGHEMGSIRIEESPESELPRGFSRVDLGQSGLVVSSLWVARAAECGVTSDCAIALLDRSNSGIIVATAPAPGAVVLWMWGCAPPRTEFDPTSFVWRQVYPSE